ncbi:invasion-inducing protein tiam1 cdc24 [Ceraceosorus bombacis]|uniref:Invasion-inducing protein tiam1 cdc24 n=1 Tax=Ceraceosorus bombacis TaxID=401625 RepID=A0A0P1B8D1_9BASI|nr:invasion-inducing protein tiam1 cdc24 [Ceraceosorus bombacis]
MSKPPPFAASREHAGKVGEEGQMDQDPAPKGADDHSAGNLTKASGSSLTLAHPYSTRRPSAASIYSNSSGRRSSHGRQRSPYRNPASPPTTPLGTKSSRSKILASSAVASVEGSRWPSGDLPSPNSSIQSHRDSPSSAASDHQPQIPNESTTRASGPRPSSKASTRGRRVASAGDADPISRALPEEEVPPVPSLRPQRVQGLASSRPSSPLSVEATSPLASAGSRWIPTASASMFDLAHSKARLRGGQADVAATLSSSASADVLHGHTGHAVEASPGNEGTGAGSSAIKSTLRSRLFGLRKAKVTNGVPQADTRAHLDDSGSPSSDMSASSSNRSTSKLAAAEALQIAVATTPEEEQNAEARAAPTYPPPPVPGMANSQSQPVQLANADHLSEGVQGPAANGLRSSTPQSGSALLHPFGAAASLARSESSSSRSRESIGAEIEGAVGADEAYSHISKRSLGKLQEHASYESDARPSEGLLSASHPSEGSSPATPFFPADSSFLRLQDRARAGREEESTASEATHAVSSAALAPAAVIRNEALDRTPRARERSGSMGDRGSPKPQLGGRRPGTAEGSPRSDARLRPQSMGASPMQSPISEDSLSETRLSRSNSKRHSRRESAGSYRSLAASIAAPLPRTSSLRNTQDVLSDTPGRPSLPRRSSSTTPTTPRSPLSATRTLDSPRTKLLQMQGSSSTLSLHEAEPSSPISPASTSPSTRPSKMPGAVAALAARFENAAALRPALNGRAQHSSAPPAQGQAHDPLASAGQAELSLGASVSSIRARLGAFPTLGSRLGSGHHVNAPSPVPEEDSTSASHGLGSSQTSQDTPHLHSVLGHPLPLNQAETLEDQSSRTSISDSTAPASRLASPSIGAIESRRPALPQKNALRARAVAKSNQLGANAESGSAISAAGEPESNGCSAENAPLSPVRSSLETFAPTLDALGFSPRGEDVAFDHASASAVSVGSPASSQTGFPPWHQGVQLQPAPTPKKGGHRLSKQSPQLSVGSSVESPVGPPVPAKAAIDEPVELLDGLDTSSQPDLLEKHSQTSLTPGSQDGSSTSWRTLRKVSPSEVLGSKRKPGPSRPSSAHGESDSTVEVGTVSAKKKSSKRWPFSSKDSPDSAVTPDTISPGSFFGRSLRTRRPTEPSRPQIRRLFDSPQEEDGENGVIQAKTSMPLLRRRTSEGSEVSLGQFPSSATTDAQITHTMEQTSSAPLSPRDELSPELRRLLRRRNVISELVETEKSYASDLAVVRDIYLARARARILFLCIPSAEACIECRVAGSGNTESGLDLSWRCGTRIELLAPFCKHHWRSYDEFALVRPL